MEDTAANTSKHPTLLQRIKERANCYSAEFELTTTALIFGGQKDCELREPSVKGVLRFWWRALYWAKVRKYLIDIEEISEPTHDQILCRLHELEKLIWGSATEDTQAYSGKSCVSLKIHRPRSWHYNNQMDLEPRDPLAHLIGQQHAPWKKNKSKHEIATPNLAGGQQFTLRLYVYPRRYLQHPLFSKHFSIEEHISLAVACLGTFGGIGARAHNGLGSLNLLSFTDAANTNCTDQAIAELKSHIESAQLQITELPPIPAFSSYTQHKGFFESQGANRKAEEALAVLAKEYQYCRQSYQNQELSDFANWAATHQQPAQIPDRFYLGLPIVWKVPQNSFTSLTQDYQIKGALPGHDRRASLYFLHIRKHENGFSPAVLLLGSQYGWVSASHDTLRAKFTINGLPKDVKHYEPEFSNADAYIANETFVKNLINQLGI
ncbi:type III-B CRISPR module RAMP protein Cmr1 [Alteromonas gilva]|uniref:Type III-B CRISPR module RAMP protein Cmr1 n=1 Tax=Alteromonas gilva TaxID=2987522 RepID=A0ABT5L4T9_9ALTE|nr:type III-B CRISPR module RAMP protein Cmr1 [Alteromonas gilva]MDC8832068.1 type III-B CRISPR module RAMP protein Cmr1 [Alteromonas gilva]